MSIKRTSVIWTIPQSEFLDIIKSRDNYAAILRHFDLHVGAGNYKTLKKRILEEKIDISHFNKNFRPPKIKSPIEQFLVTNSTYCRTSLKKRLLAEGLLLNKCYVCSLSDVWQGKKLSLQIDHINGISNDNRIENLRIICPNCHSQTDTFSGKHNRINKKVNKKCLDCDAVVFTKKSIRCQRCANIITNKPKIVWPEKETLISMVKQYNYVGTGRKLGVSDNAIRKHLRK